MFESVHSNGAFCVRLSMLRIVQGEYVLPVSLLPAQEELYMLPFLFDFRKVIAVGCFKLISSLKDGCGTYCVCCMTLVDVVCSVRGVV